MSANDFYFKDSTFDYYLSKNQNQTSHMEVKEQLTAVFPETNQNHGIERCIPEKYRGVKSLETSSFRVTRNGETEPYSTYESGDFVCFRIGKASEYVHGEQVYDISYALNNVILDPDNSDNLELYWDTNGTGWYQRFEKLTATVHLAEDTRSNSFIPATPSCYVGKYGTGGAEATSRCKITENADGYTFATTDLAPQENLTFDLEFAPNSFVVPKDLSGYFTAAAITLGVALLAVLKARATKKMKARNAEKLALADGPKPVQYTPPKDLSVAQSQKVWLTTKFTDIKVASLMELAVRHHIELEKAEKTSKVFKVKSNVWKIHVKNLDGISREQKIVLEILNGGDSVSAGDVIEVETQKYSSKLERLNREFDTDVKADLRSKSLFEPSKNVKTSILAAKYNKYEERTKQGIETSNYLDGLKEYIELAEADRIKFLHSVKSADTSPQGIVKLYEKLLPYAILFGCEDSWLKELEKYYKMPEVSDPDWLMAGYMMSSSDFRAFRTATTSSISSATASSSSGSSGGGGGGFSGGGGGGGGGGGW